MDLLNFIFRLGVVFAIFGFVWGLINIAIRMLTIGRQRQLGEVYILKGAQYLFLVNVTFLICYNHTIAGLTDTSQLVFGSAVLLMYFVGKLQNQQKKQNFLKIYTNSGMISSPTIFSTKAEIAVILLAISMFITFWFNPNWAYNPISLWFESTILGIEDTPIFGFIFKVIGFFFLINIIQKLVVSILMILTGRAFVKSTSQVEEKENDRSEDDFDEYEEIN